MTSAPLNMLGPMAELGGFQRSRVRRTAAAIAAMTAVCIALVLVSIALNGVGVTFSSETPVRLPILALIAAVLLTPIVWSAVFRSRSYGMTLTRDALIVTSWWRTQRFERAELASADPGPAVMRMRDGFFSGAGTDAAPFAVWLTLSSSGSDAFPLGVTTGTKGATVAASRRSTLGSRSRTASTVSRLTQPTNDPLASADRLRGRTRAYGWTVSPR